jgi:hypothetical protein
MDKQDKAWQDLVQAFKNYMEFEPDFEFIVCELEKVVYD